MTPTLLELAEDYPLYIPPRPGFIHDVTPGYVLTSGNSGANVNRIRLRDHEVEGALDAVRNRIAGERLERCTWWCGSLTTPDDLDQRLLALGLVPDEDAPTLRAMVLDHAPSGEPRAEVRRVETSEDFRTAMAVDMDATNPPPPVRARREAMMDQLWTQSVESGAVHYLGFVDGVPAAMARAYYVEGATLLRGAATLPAYRGLGVYTALVHARWREAAARGTPRLVVQAGPMSRSILEKVGFETLGEIALLVDRV